MRALVRLTLLLALLLSSAGASYYDEGDDEAGEDESWKQAVSETAGACAVDPATGKPDGACAARRKHARSRTARGTVWQYPAGATPPAQQPGSGAKEEEEANPYAEAEDDAPNPYDDGGDAAAGALPAAGQHIESGAGAELEAEAGAQGPGQRGGEAVEGYYGVATGARGNGGLGHWQQKRAAAARLEVDDSPERKVRSVSWLVFLLFVGIPEVIHVADLRANWQAEAALLMAVVDGDVAAAAAVHIKSQHSWQLLHPCCSSLLFIPAVTQELRSGADPNCRGLLPHEVRCNGMRDEEGAAAVSPVSPVSLPAVSVPRAVLRRLTSFFSPPPPPLPLSYRRGRSPPRPCQASRPCTRYTTDRIPAVDSSSTPRCQMILQ